MASYLFFALAERYSTEQITFPDEKDIASGHLATLQTRTTVAAIKASLTALTRYICYPQPSLCISWQNDENKVFRDNLLRLSTTTLEEIVCNSYSRNGMGRGGRGEFERFLGKANRSVNLFVTVRGQNIRDTVDFYGSQWLDYNVQRNIFYRWFLIGLSLKITVIFFYKRESYYFIIVL